MEYVIGALSTASSRTIAIRLSRRHWFRHLFTIGYDTIEEFNMEKAGTESNQLNLAHVTKTSKRLDYGNSVLYYINDGLQQRVR